MAYGRQQIGIRLIQLLDSDKDAGPLYLLLDSDTDTTLWHCHIGAVCAVYDECFFCAVSMCFAGCA